MNAYHTTDEQAWAPHVGACLTPCDRAQYGEYTAVVDLRLAGLKVERIQWDAEEMRRRVDAQDWCGDYDIDAYRADGVDVIVYDDCDPNGREHVTYRLASDDAVSACAVVSRSSDDDEDEDA